MISQTNCLSILNFFFSSRRRHTRCLSDWSSDVCSSDLLPPGTVHGGIKITEQGEIVSQNFGLLSIAERSLELMLSGVLVHRFEDWRDALEPGEEARFREIMDRLAA